MSDQLAATEAVPLGTAHLQGLLDSAGVRSLAIKGPAFVALEVRAPRHSNDIDLIIHPDDRSAATKALTRAGWSIISHWFPAALDDIIYSTTFRHARFPVTLDLHHRFSGLLGDPAAAFEVLWRGRRAVDVAHHDVVTVDREHALVIEALNAIKLLTVDRRPEAIQQVIEEAGGGDLLAVTRATEELGARHTAASLVVALGGDEPTGPSPSGYRAWLRRGARNTGRQLIFDLVLRAPWHIPRVAWGQLTIDPETARFWAETHHVAYRSRWQVLGVRVRRLVRD